MKKILLLLTIVSFKLFGTCVKVSSNSGISCSDNSVVVDNTSKNFTTSMKVSDNGITVLDVPLYLFSDTTDAVSMTLSNNTPLSNGTTADDIGTTFYYVVGGTEYPITMASPFSLLGAGSGSRDGNTLLGYIRVKVNNLSATQTVGAYSFIKNMTVEMNSINSATAQLSGTGSVDYVTIVSFENTISGYTQGENFIDATVDYGNFVLNAQNTQIRDLYVKSNSNNPCTLSFATSDMVSQVDSNYRIAINYYYTPLNGTTLTIGNNTAFQVVNGKSDGSKVGEMKFETEALTGLLIAGDYKAVLAVTVTAR